jgi:hypothetical protein
MSKNNSKTSERQAIKTFMVVCEGTTDKFVFDHFKSEIFNCRNSGSTYKTFPSGGKHVTERMEIIEKNHHDYDYIIWIIDSDTYIQNVVQNWEKENQKIAKKIKTKLIFITCIEGLMLDINTKKYKEDITSDELKNICKEEFGHNYHKQESIPKIFERCKQSSFIQQFLNDNKKKKLLNYNSFYNLVNIFKPQLCPQNT